MLNRFIIGAFLLVIMTLAVEAVGANVSPPQGKWWRIEKVSQRLNLTRSEIEQLDTAFRESRRKLIKLKSVLETERFELETLVDNPVLDERAVLSQYDKLEKARGALGSERFRFLLSVRKIIGYEKFQKLLLLKKAMDRKRGR